MNRDQLFKDWNKFMKERTPRELIMGVIALIVGVLFSVYTFAYEPMVTAFAAQMDQFRDIAKTTDVAPSMLARYLKLAARRRELEDFYAKADIKVDPLTHLERMLREVAKVNAGAYNVSPRDGVQLGGKYMHKIFGVKFETSSLDDLAAFLRALTTGDQRMLVSQINLEKRANGEALSVQLEVSGFEVVPK